MLSREDLYFNFKVFSQLCKWNFIPFIFNATTGETRVQQSETQVWLWRLNTLGIVGFGIWNLFCVAQALTCKQCFSLEHFIVNSILAGAIPYSLALFLCVNAYQRDGWAFLMNIMNGRLVQQFPGSLDWDLRTRLRYMLSTLRSHSILELTTMGVSAGLLGASLMGHFIFSYHYDANYMLYFHLPERYKGWLSIPFSVLLQDALCLQLSLTAAAVLYPIVGFFPYLLNNTFDDFKTLLKSRNATLQSPVLVCRLYVIAQLEVQTFNQVYALVNYIIKILFLFVSVLSIFIGIKIHTSNPIFSLLMLSIGSEAMLAFVLFYGKMFQIPQTIHDYRRRFVFTFQFGKGRDIHRRYIERRMLAVGPCAVRAGHFYDLERMSSLTYLDFVAKQVANLLVASLK